MTFRFHLSKAEINIWPFELNYEHTKCKDLRILSWKQISCDLRVFGVKFLTQIFIRVKNLTFCKSACQCINLVGIISSPSYIDRREREIKVLLERNISVIWQHMFQMSALPVQPIYMWDGVRSKTFQSSRNYFQQIVDCVFLIIWLKLKAG